MSSQTSPQYQREHASEQLAAHSRTRPTCQRRLSKAAVAHERRLAVRAQRSCKAAANDRVATRRQRSQRHVAQPVLRDRIKKIIR